MNTHKWKGLLYSVLDTFLYYFYLSWFEEIDARSRNCVKVVAMIEGEVPPQIRNFILFKWGLQSIKIRQEKTILKILMIYRRT